MRSTVVPAQITTVEDRIAGNLTFTQIIMFVIPLVTSTTVYVLIPPQSQLGLFKLVLICIQILIFGILAIRIRGKILADWLIIYIKFKIRPRVYIFTKNDLNTREFINIENKKPPINKKQSNKKRNSLTLSPPLPDQSKIDDLITNPRLKFRFGLSKKGGIDVRVVSEKK